MGFHTSCTTFSAKDLCLSLMYVLKIQNIVSSTIHFPSFLKSTDPAYPQNIQIHTHIFSIGMFKKSKSAFQLKMPNIDLSVPFAFNLPFLFVTTESFHKHQLHGYIGL